MCIACFNHGVVYLIQNCVDSANIYPWYPPNTTIKCALSKDFFRKLKGFLSFLFINSFPVLFHLQQNIIIPFANTWCQFLVSHACKFHNCFHCIFFLWFLLLDKASFMFYTKLFDYSWTVEITSQPTQSYFPHYTVCDAHLCQLCIYTQIPCDGLENDIRQDQEIVCYPCFIYNTDMVPRLLA